MPANPNPLQPLLDRIAALTSQLDDYTLQAQDVEKQYKAVIRREEDLRQQLDKLQTEISHLSILQIGPRMRLHAEQDNIRKKLNLNQQLQQSLRLKQEKLNLTVAVAQRNLEQLQQTLREDTAAQETAQADEQPADAGVPDEPAMPAAPETAAPPQPAKDGPRRAARPSAPRKPAVRRAHADGAAEPPLQEAVAHLLSRLELLYPEHQVYALDSLNADLRDRLGSLTTRSGFATPAEFLKSQGWQMISTKEAMALRRGKHVIPGEEPEVIRTRLDSVLNRLKKHYPDYSITRSIQHDHKSLAQDVSGLYIWLGYDSIAAMLTAYGFRYDVPAGGRPATDVPALLEALRTAYADSEKPRSIARIAADHPEYAGALKTLQNQAPARFGMSLREYLAQLGILAPRSSK
ncbi:MAG: hypothetical protein IJ343_15800 [Clostridia bacterium]|nr:hypothetical protein [Clostridia bacterium]